MRHLFSAEAGEAALELLPSMNYFMNLYKQSIIINAKLEFHVFKVSRIKNSEDCNALSQAYFATTFVSGKLFIESPLIPRLHANQSHLILHVPQFASKAWEMIF